MDRKETVETNRFIAESEDKQQFLLIVFQDFVITTTMDGSVSRIPTLKSIRTLDGHAVNLIDDNTFEIVQLSLRVKKVSK